MKTILTHFFCWLVLFVFAASNTVTAQNLLKSKQTGSTTYIYQINNLLAQDIALGKHSQYPDTVFSHLIDSIDMRKSYNFEKLRAGHYLKTDIVQNKLVSTLVTVPNCFPTIINNEGDFILRLADSAGNSVDDALVRINNKKICFDRKINAYRLAKSNHRGNLIVSWKGLVQLFSLYRSKNTPQIVQQYGSFCSSNVGCVTAYPFSNLVLHAQNYFKNLFVFRSGYYNATIVFNKPLYRKNDTLRAKLILTNRKLRPVKKKLLVYIGNRYSPKLVDTVYAYKRGFFSISIPLNDTLELQQDRSYVLEFRKRPRKHIAMEYFKIEDYELNKNSYSISTSQSSQYRGKKFELILNGKDENNLPLYDALFTVAIVPETVSRIYSDKVLVSDTLLFIKEQKLSSSGASIVTIPDSTFPNADLRCKIIVTFRNADNERIEKTTSYTFYHRKQEILFTSVHDSLSVGFAVNDSLRDTTISICYSDPHCKDSSSTIAASSRIGVPSKYSIIHARVGNVDSSFQVSNISSLVSWNASRDKDSLHFVLQNPRHLPVSYFFFKANKLLNYGTDTNIEINRSAGVVRMEYVMILSYWWAGELKTERIPFVLDKYVLHLDVNQKQTIAPGQSTIIDFLVTNYKGKPLKGVDLTAWAYTSKFKNNTSEQVYLGRMRFHYKSFYNYFSVLLNKSFCINTHISASLFKQSHLDTIEYYKFHYPNANLYHFSYPLVEKNTQIAPFVMKNGEILPIHVIEIDRLPVFYSWTTGNVPYSFPCSSIISRLHLRTDSLDVYLNNIVLKSNEKNIISIDVDRCRDSNVTINHISKKRPYELDQTDWEFYKRTMMFIMFGGKSKYIAQDNRVFRADYSVYGIGPVFERSIDFIDVEKNHSYDFTFEPFYRYRMERNAVKMFPNANDFFINDLRRYRRDYSLSDSALSRGNIYVKPLRKNKIYLKNEFSKSPNGNVKILTHDFDNLPEYIYLEAKNEPSHSRYFYTNDKVFYNIAPDIYTVWIFSNDSLAYCIDSVIKCANSTTYIDIQNKKIITIPTYMSSRFKYIDSSPYKWPEKVTKTLTSLNNCKDCFTISGTVMDGKFGGPLPGACIKILGTNYGAQTDFDGNFTLRVPVDFDTVEVSFMGYTTKQIPISGHSKINTTLMQNPNEIYEVHVVGYGVQKKYDVTGSVSTIGGVDIDSRPVKGFFANLADKVAGVQVRNNSGSPGSSEMVSVRGVGTVNDGEPMYLVDGVVMQSIKHISPSDIAKIEVEKDNKKCAQYGSRGANGIIIITTNKNSGSVNPFLNEPTDLSAFSGERNKFRDDAFWQPKLLTDKQGRATMRVTFPDDITNWQTNYLAYKSGGYVGVWRGNIKAMKPLSAQLSLPRFLIEGDTSYCIGKTLNYLPQAQKLRIGIQINDVQTQRDSVVTQIVIDSLQVIAPRDKDSVKLRYQISVDSSFTDAETRYIPVFARGRLESQGSFFALRDTFACGMRPADPQRKIAVYAENFPISAMLKEIENIYTYPRGCNEQSASKLIALLLEKKMMASMKKTFTHQDEVKALIEKLETNQNTDGLWGWWERNQTESWISQHVIEALLLAKSEGFTTKLTTEVAGRNLVWMLESRKTTQTIQTMLLLHRLDSLLPLDKYLPLAKEQSTHGIANYFSYLELLQTLHRPANLDTMDFYKSHSRFNQISYHIPWRGCYIPYYNDMQMNLTAYRILRNDSCTPPQQLQSVRDFFLNQRQNAYWRNTYESVTILSTILPDLLKDNDTDTTTTLFLCANGHTQSITKFPYRDSVAACDSISIHKRGMSPIYFSATQTVFNPKPVAEIKPFTVNTFIDNSRNKRVKLLAGKPIELRVEVYMTYSAEYVMIDVPIPAACSYASKPQPDSHREYNKDRTFIYCNRLSEGMHTFVIPLTPRYNGSYTLNPARAELMYFSTEHGQEDTKRVEVR